MSVAKTGDALLLLHVSPQSRDDDRELRSEPVCSKKSVLFRKHSNEKSFGIQEETSMVFANLKIGSALVALICIAVAPNASAVTAEVAKKCNALTAKAYPPRVVGNPAAGSAKGTGQSQRDYFNKCVANGGNMDDPSSKEAK